MAGSRATSARPSRFRQGAGFPALPLVPNGRRPGAKKAAGVALPVKPTTLTQGSAICSGSRSCSPSPDVVLLKPWYPCDFFRAVLSFADTGSTSP